VASNLKIANGMIGQDSLDVSCPFIMPQQDYGQYLTQQLVQ
jgi:hypothetical protein